MTQDELFLLSQGKVPADKIFQPVLARLEMLDYKRAAGEPGALILLCERQELDYSTIARTIYRYEHPEGGDPCRALDFDIADKLLCGVYLFDMWWGDLADYYNNVDLTWARCSCPGCEVRYQKRHPLQLYCSKACRHSARHQRIGRTTRPVKVHREGRWDKKCRNGHTRTTENTVLRKNGKRECLICKRAANNESYASRQQALRMTRLRECEHPECSVSFAPRRTDQKYCSNVCRDGARKFKGRLLVAVAA